MELPYQKSHLCNGIGASFTRTKTQLCILLLLAAPGIVNAQMCPIQAVAQNVTVQLNSSGSGTVSATAVNNGSQANCGTAATSTLSVAPTTVSCSDVTPSAATNTALTFNGTNQYVAIGNTAAVPVGNSTYTIEAWIKPTQMGDYGIIGWGNYGATNQVNALRLSASGVINYWWLNDLVRPTASLVGAWHHVVATFDGTTRRLYVDGVALGSDTPGTGHAVPNANNLRIGSTNVPGPGNPSGTNEYFPGSIDDVRVWSRALTPAEVSQSAARTNPTSLVGLVARWDMREGTGSALADMTGNSPAGTLVNAPTWTTPGIAYQGVMAVLTVTDAEGYTSRAAATVTVTDATAPVAVAQNRTANVSISGRVYVSPNTVNNGSSDNCAITNVALSASSFGTCAASAALNLDGANDYVSLPAGITASAQNFTFETWVNYTDNGLWTRIMDFGTGTNVYMLLTPKAGWDAASNNKVAFAISTGGNPSEQRLVSNTVMPTGWHHLAVTLSKTGSVVTGTLYLDGTVIGTNGAMTLTPEDLGNLTQNWLGRSQYGSDPYFRGQLDEVRIWSVARTAAQINLYKDKSLAGNTPGLLAYYDINDAPNSATLLNRGSAGGVGTLNNLDAATAFQAPGQVPALGVGANTVTLTVSDAAGNVTTTTATVTITPPSTPTTNWNGGVSSEWTNCSNWSFGKVPDATTNATIQLVSTNRYPSIPSGTVVANTLTLNAGTSLALASGATLQVNGNWVNSGAVGTDLSGTVMFTGPAATQTIGGSANTSFGTVEVNKSAGTVQLGRNLSIGTALAMTSGTLTTGSANQVELGTSASITSETDAHYVIGNVLVTRLLNAPAVNTFGGIGLSLAPSGSTLPGSTSVRRVTGTPLTGVGSSVSIGRYFDIQPTVNTGLNVDMVFSYFNHELNSIPVANLALFKSSTTAGPWVWQRPIAAGPNTVSKSGITGFSVWTLGNAANPLPVELTDFTATAQGSSAVYLAWATASESNSAGFTVERSADAQVFAPVSTVAGAGNSTTHRSYRLLDSRVPLGATRLYYRLKQTDLDGTNAYSPVRTVELGTPAVAQLVAYPNPAHGVVRVQLLGKATAAPLQLVDAVGRVVLTYPAPAAGADTALPISGLPTGLYIIRCGTLSERITVE